MTTARTGFFNKLWYYEKTAVTVASNDGETAVVFATAFSMDPDVTILTPRGAAGTYQVKAASLSETGFTLEVTGETDTDYDDQIVEVIWFAHEKY